jgi:hypothetical protein
MAVGADAVGFSAGGRSGVERAEAGWNRPEPAPRWRSLLGRSRSTIDEAEQDDLQDPSVVPPRRSDLPPDHRTGTTYGSAPVRPHTPPPAPVPVPAPPPVRPATYGAPGRGVGRGTVGVGGLAGRVEWQQAKPPSEVDQLIAVLRRDLRGPKVFAFANPKGGVHKTTATVLAAATVGSVRGRGVSRGTTTSCAARSGSGPGRHGMPGPSGT